MKLLLIMIMAGSIGLSQNYDRARYETYNNMSYQYQNYQNQQYQYQNYYKQNSLNQYTDELKKDAASVRRERENMESYERQWKQILRPSDNRIWETTPSITNESCSNNNNLAEIPLNLKKIRSEINQGLLDAQGKADSLSTKARADYLRLLSNYTHEICSQIDDIEKAYSASSTSDSLEVTRRVRNTYAFYETALKILSDHYNRNK